MSGMKQNNMNRMQNQYNQNYAYSRNDMNQNQRQNMNNMVNPQAQNINLNQNQPQNLMNLQQNQRLNNLQMNNPMQTSVNENSEFIKNIENILQLPHSEERTENLGEIIFYYLLDFIPKYKLNVTGGQFDDTILCSKLTGILIHEDDQEIVDIVSNTENLLIFIKNVVMVFKKFLTFLVLLVNLFFVNN